MVAKAKDRFYEGLLKQARKLGGLVRVTLIDEGVALVSYEDKEPKPEFDQLCEKVRSGEAHPVIVDIETVRFFTQSDWEKLRDAGLETVVLYKSEADVL